MSRFKLDKNRHLSPKFIYKEDGVAQDISAAELTFGLFDSSLATTPIFTKKNTAAGGGDAQISWVDDGTDGEFYVDDNQDFTSTPTWITASGTTSWSSNTSIVNWTAGVEYTISARSTDMAGNQSSKETCAFTFANSVSGTTLTITLSAQRILFGDTLDISGKLTPLPDSGQSMEGLEITIDVTSPSGLAGSQYTAITNKFGQYTLTDITGFGEEGPWTLQARFDGIQNLYKSSDSAVNSLLVGESAGYAIIVQGKIPTGEGVLSHNKTANRIYKKLIERNFDPDDIYYFNYITSQIGVDASPARTGIQNAIEGTSSWDLDGKIAASPAPLYIIMENHGNINKFHVNNEVYDFTFD